MITLNLGTIELEALKKALREQTELAIINEVKLCDVWVGRQRNKRNKDPQSEYTRVTIGVNEKRYKLVDSNGKELKPNLYYEFFKLGILYNVENEKNI